MSQDITIRFATEEAAMHFAGWLCGSGEQQYWDWMTYREDEEAGDITATRFFYHGQSLENEHIGDAHGEFMCDWTIRTCLGRVTQSGDEIASNTPDQPENKPDSR